MYAVSNDFHTAIKNGNRQKAMLIFSDCVFTDEDINVDSGIQFHDYFNTDEDISIGQATSNEITFTLFNDARLLNNYTFGEFVALLGVHLRTTAYIQDAPVMIDTKYATYKGFDQYPYLYRGSSAVAAQPSFPIQSILAYDDKVWVFGKSGKSACYNDKTGASISGNKPNAFMKAKVIRWEGKGIYYNKDSRILKICEAGDKLWYEFCPLGTFVADRPNAPDQIMIDMDCFDRMEKFDVDMPPANELGMTYPATIGTLYERICRRAGVPYSGSGFINSGAVIPEEPEDFQRVSMRDVLKWIAEAAGANARFNRDGVLELAWLRNTSQRYAMTNYQEFNPYWYKTKKVTQLCNRDTQESIDTTYGGGEEKYLIQDNPLLRGVI